jgi:chromosome partitioning protein
VRALLDSLKLPLDERGRRRAAARAEWVAALDKPLDLQDVVGE